MDKVPQLFDCRQIRNPVVSFKSGPCCLLQEVRQEGSAWTGSWKAGIGNGFARPSLPVFDMRNFPWFLKYLKQDPAPPALIDRLYKYGQCSWSETCLKAQSRDKARTSRHIKACLHTKAEKRVSSDTDDKSVSRS